MKILLVNVDARFNLAIRRMYNYFMQKGDEVTMVDLKLTAYPLRSGKPHHKDVDATGYDRVYVSNLFDINKDAVTVTGCDWVEYGGIGSNFPTNRLPDEIESTPPHYTSEEDTSVGFLTRGCIRNCWFCKVPKYEGKLKEYNKVEDIVQHKNAVFLDNNILAYNKHLEVFQWLIDHNIKCNFNQGLDWRLVNEKNLELLGKMRYISSYIFAFDDIKYQAGIEKVLPMIKKYLGHKCIGFYVYYHPSTPIHDLIYRCEWCRAHKCYPYIQRDISCWSMPTDDKNFVIDWTSYVNQYAVFKKMTFEEFMKVRHEKDLDRRNKSIELYHKYSEGIKF